jgi:ABC-type thiamine transport system substrate-binding protein
VKNSFAPGDAGKKQHQLARDFLDFLISPEVQDLVAKHQWMYPARQSTKLPPSFVHVPRPKKVVHLKVKADEIQTALSSWSKAVEGKF